MLHLIACVTSLLPRPPKPINEKSLQVHRTTTAEAKRQTSSSAPSCTSSSYSSPFLESRGWHVFNGWLAIYRFYNDFINGLNSPEYYALRSSPHQGNFDELYPEAKQKKGRAEQLQHVQVLRIPAGLKSRLESRLEQLQEVTRKCGSESYKTLLHRMWIVQFLTLSGVAMVQAYHVDNMPSYSPLPLAGLASLTLSALQFILLPMSAPPAFMYCMMYLPRFCSHYAAGVIVSVLTMQDSCFGLLAPLKFYNHLDITVNWAFVIWVLLLDHFLSLCFYLRYCERVSAKKFLTHVVYSFVNTRFNFLLTSAVLWQETFSVPQMLLVWMTDHMLHKFVYRGEADDMNRPPKQYQYYLQHRLAHLPSVYQQAHKMHHHLQDALPFDGQFFQGGAGYLETWGMCQLLQLLPYWGAEIVSGAICAGLHALGFVVGGSAFAAPSARVLCPLPFAFSWYGLDLSFEDKWEHTRCTPDIMKELEVNHKKQCDNKPEKSLTARMRRWELEKLMPDAENYHADHHTWHNKNFAIPHGVLLDMYFNTHAPQRESKAEGDGSACSFGLRFARKAVTEGRDEIVEIRLCRVGAKMQD